MPHSPARVAEETHTTVVAGSRIRSAAGAPPASATVSTNVSRASDAMRRIAVSVPGGSAGTPRAGDGPASNGTPSIVVINFGRTDGAIGQDIAAMSDGQYSAGWSAPALRAPHIGTESTMTGSSPRRCANAPASNRVIVVRPAPPSQPTTGTVAPRRTGWRASSSRARRLSSSGGTSARGTAGRRPSSASSARTTVNGAAALGTGTGRAPCSVLALIGTPLSCSRYRYLALLVHQRGHLPAGV